MDPDVFNKLLQSGGDIAEPAQAQPPPQTQQAQHPDCTQSPQSRYQQPQLPQMPTTYQISTPPPASYPNNTVATWPRIPMQSLPTLPMPLATSIRPGDTPGAQALKQAYAAAMQRAFTPNPFMSQREAMMAPSLAADRIRRMNAIIDHKGEDALPEIIEKLHELDIDPAAVGLADGTADLATDPVIMPRPSFGFYPRPRPYGRRYLPFPPFGGSGWFGF